MATVNVQFYERIKELQDIQHQSEEKRIQLEHQLDGHVKSDQRLAKLRAVKLQNYWKKICEDEKRSQWRNEQLLRDFDRVESQMAALSARTERLRQMKKQYEDYIERVYPQWKEKIQQKQKPPVAQAVPTFPAYGAVTPTVQIGQQLGMGPTSGMTGLGQAHQGGMGQAHQGGMGQAHQGGMGQAHQGGMGQAHQGGMGQSYTGGIGQSYTGMGQSHTGGMGQFYTGGMGQSHTGGMGQSHTGGMGQSYTGGIGQSGPQFGTNTSVWGGEQSTGLGFSQHGTTQPPQISHPNAQQLTPQHPQPSGGTHIPPQPPGGTHIPSQPQGGTGLLGTGNESTLQTISSLPTGVSLSSTQGELVQAYVSAQNSETLGASGLQGTFPVPEGQATYDINRGPTHAVAQPEEDHSHKTPTTQVKQPSPRHASLERDGGGGDTARDADDTWRSEASLPPQTPRSVEGKGSARNPSAEEEISDFGDDSLPLTEKDLTGPVSESGNKAVPRSARSQGSVKSNRTMSPDVQLSPRREDIASPIADLSQSEASRSVYPAADVTLDGLYNMLDAVQSSLSSTRRAHEFYRTGTPAESVRKDIIENANRGAIMSHLDPTSISMIVIDQLPLVVTNCEDKCLLKDKILVHPPAEVTDQIIKSHLHPASHAFWDKFYDHCFHLLRHRIMQPAEVATIFAPHLIDAESPYDEEAQSVLVSLFEGVTPDDGFASPTSTATLSSLAPTRPDIPQDVPPLDLGKSGSTATATVTGIATAPPVEEDEDDFFSQPVPKEDTATLPTFTQSAAYRKMLGETMSTQRTMTYEESEEDSEDEIEKQLTTSVKSPRSKNPMSTLGSTGMGTMSSMGGTGEQHTLSVPHDESESEVSSPKPSPTGYVPSALTSTGKSTMSMSSKSVGKKPAFYGDSDTDEDIDIPGTGSQKHGLDEDFEFYA